MTREDQTVANLKKLKSVHNGSYGADIDIAIKALKQQSCEDCISRADALRAAKNEYLRGWHDALCKVLNETHSIHCEDGNFSIIQEETITGLGLSMNCALGKDVESYMSTIPSVTPTRKKGKWKLVQVGKRVDLCCANCGAVRVKEIAYNYTIDQLNKFFKEDYKEFLKMPDMSYCPSCGVKMENEE